MNEKRTVKSFWINTALLTIGVLIGHYAYHWLKDPIQQLHTKAFPHNHTFAEAVDSNEIVEIRKQLVLTVQDMKKLFNNDRILKQQFNEMHPVMDPNEETE